MLKVVYDFIYLALLYRDRHKKLFNSVLKRISEGVGVAELGLTMLDVSCFLILLLMELINVFVDKMQ